MFGQDTQNEENQDTTTIQPSTDDTSSTDTVTVDTGTTDDTSDTSAAVASDDAASPASDSSDASSSDAEPAADESKAETETDAPAETPASSTPSPVADDALLDIKKEALSDLAPLVDHLDQTPEEHFRTIMMLIQATDDSSYVKAAYESAKKISDDDERAQALLDIVNEINYFTQASSASEDS